MMVKEILILLYAPNSWGYSMETDNEVMRDYCYPEYKRDHTAGEVSIILAMKWWESIVIHSIKGTIEQEKWEFSSRMRREFELNIEQIHTQQQADSSGATPTEGADLFIDRLIWDWLIRKDTL